MRNALKDVEFLQIEPKGLQKNSIDILQMNTLRKKKKYPPASFVYKKIPTFSRVKI